MVYVAHIYNYCYKACFIEVLIQTDQVATHTLQQKTDVDSDRSDSIRHTLLPFPPKHMISDRLFFNLWQDVFFITIYILLFLIHGWFVSTGCCCGPSGSAFPDTSSTKSCIHACFNVTSKLNISAPVFLTLENFVFIL